MASKVRLAMVISALTSLFASLQPASTLNIVVIATVPSPSHYIFGNAMTTLLLNRGHHVYELTTMPAATPHPNRTSFIIEQGVEKSEGGLADISLQSNIESLDFIGEFSPAACKYVLDSKAGVDFLAFARDVKKRPKIDVVVHDYAMMQCLAPFAVEFDNAPLIAMTAYGYAIEMDEVLGGPTFPAYIPHDIIAHPPGETMGWLKRMENKLVYIYSWYVRVFHQFPQMNVHSKEFFGENCPTVEEMQERVALVMVNSHPAIQGARPSLPAVIQIGGYHVAPPKELPAGEMKDFLDSAKDGFILMSFGSYVQISDMEPWRRAELIRAFRRLSPLRILMKWEVPWNESQDGPLPDNLFISPWIPQSHVQAHPNIRLFVTHCGGLSTIEIATRALPIVGVPFFVDQYLNAVKLSALNIGVLLPYVELRENTFYDAVRKVLDDKKYLNAVRRLSLLYLDQPETPQERAVYWVEFVARHGGAPHLHSPARHLPWIVRWMVDDVLLVLIVIVLLSMAIRRLCRCSTRSKLPNSATKSKRE